jgi:phospholipid transport system substrate-binding protein
MVGAAAALVVGLIGLGAARAAPGDDAAQRVVDAALRDTLQMFGGQVALSREEATVRLRDLLDHYVDLPRVGRDSLGAHWRRATPEQQAAFLAVFERFLCVGYSGSAMRTGGLRFGPTAVVGRDDGVTVVRTDVQLSDGSAQPVLFIVDRSDDGSYRITDVVAAAISMSRLFSADFVAVLRNNGGQFDALIDALTNKLAAASANP